MSGKAPRVVVVTRPTEYELLIARHATRPQAKFFLDSRGQDIGMVEERHARFVAALEVVMHAIPLVWRRNRVVREELDRFLFEPEDTVVVVGQDGLVANVAKYLDGQLVLGVNPDRSSYDGVLVPLDPGAARELLVPAAERKVTIESRTMVEARLDDGQLLLALNEVFVGHRSHQSARYSIAARGTVERQSSSGIVVASGTGATGWARSIHRERRTEIVLPTPSERRLAFFVREAFPSVASGTTLTDGSVAAGERVEIVSEMNEGGVVFGDGIEADHLVFDWGMKLDVAVAKSTLELVRP
jgi:NAD kinase